MQTSLAHVVSPIGRVKRAHLSGFGATGGARRKSMIDHVCIANVSAYGRPQFVSAVLSDTAIETDRAERRQEMLALLDRINANRERLRAKYGEFDVDSEIYAMREERDRYLDSI